MAMIVSLFVPDGIVIGAENRTVIRKDVRKPSAEGENAEKPLTVHDVHVIYHEPFSRMVVFRDRLVVTLNQDPTDHSHDGRHLLEDVRNETKDEELTPGSLARKILDTWDERKSKKRISFYVYGYEDNQAYIYKIKPYETVRMKREDRGNGYSFVAPGDRGLLKQIFATVIEGREFNDISLKEAVSLTDIVMHMLCVLSKFWKVQVFGDKYEIYVIRRDPIQESGYVKVHDIPLMPKGTR